ncbi:hypothetical protein EVAR_67741_1 [Eumeta japonica]|uniref:Uncharacterized protein n=1 Tax=Eumeta variegata TaxID=151549 RepID=A0A4C1ZEP6_EUMVA|nr:hypothetical protein EVAR_67741_1 [Eumeta japonica]
MKGLHTRTRTRKHTHTHTHTHIHARTHVRSTHIRTDEHTYARTHACTRKRAWHWLYRRYCACVIPLFAPQSGDSCLLRVSALGHLFVFTSWYDSTKLARIETSCSEIGRIPGEGEWVEEGPTLGEEKDNSELVSKNESDAIQVAMDNKQDVDEESINKVCDEAPNIDVLVVVEAICIDTSDGVRYYSTVTYEPSLAVACGENNSMWLCALLRNSPALCSNSFAHPKSSKADFIDSDNPKFGENLHPPWAKSAILLTFAGPEISRQRFSYKKGAVSPITHRQANRKFAVIAYLRSGWKHTRSYSMIWNVSVNCKLLLCLPRGKGWQCSNRVKP